MTISVVSCIFDSDNMDFVEIEHLYVGQSTRWAAVLSRLDSERGIFAAFAEERKADNRRMI